MNPDRSATDTVVQMENATMSDMTERRHPQEGPGGSLIVIGGGQPQRELTPFGQVRLDLGRRDPKVIYQRVARMLGKKIERRITERRISYTKLKVLVSQRLAPKRGPSRNQLRDLTNACPADGAHHQANPWTRRINQHLDGYDLAAIMIDLDCEPGSPGHREVALDLLTLKLIELSSGGFFFSSIVTARGTTARTTVTLELDWNLLRRDLGYDPLPC